MSWWGIHDGGRDGVHVIPIIYSPPSSSLSLLRHCCVVKSPAEKTQNCSLSFFLLLQTLVLDLTLNRSLSPPLSTSTYLNTLWPWIAKSLAHPSFWRTCHRPICLRFLLYLYVSLPPYPSLFSLSEISLVYFIPWLTLRTHRLFNSIFSVIRTRIET